MAAAYSLDIDLSEVLEQTDKMGEQVDGLKKAFDALGKEGGDAVLMLGSKVAEAFEKILSIIKPVRLLIWLFDILSKMNPFRMLGKAYDNIVKIYDKLKAMSEGSTERAQDAKGTRTSAKNMRLFEQSFKIMGWDRNVLKDITNAIDGGAFDALAAAGVDTEKIKKLDGVEQLFAIYEGVEKFAKNMGGYDSIAIKPIMELMEKISPIFSAQSMRGNQGIFEERKAYYRELQTKDKGDDGAMSAFEKAYGKLADSFGNLWNLIAAKLLPIFTKATKKIQEFVDAFVNFLDDNPLKKLKEIFEGFFEWLDKKFGLSLMKETLVVPVIDAAKKTGQVVWDSIDYFTDSKAKLAESQNQHQSRAAFVEEVKAKYGKVYDISKTDEMRLHKALKMLTDGNEGSLKDVNIIFGVKDGNLVFDARKTAADGSEKILARQQVIGRATK